MSYTKPQSVYGDKQTFDPKVLSTPKFGDIVFDGSEFNNAGTQVALSDQETLAYDFAKEPPQAATNLTFLINGSYYTYHPSNVLEKGLRVDNKQFYNPQVLKNLDQVYEQGQPISLENVGWYDDFLKKNDLSTEGILLPAGELNFKVGPGGNWKVREIGEVSDRVRFNEITGIGRVGDEYVYTANVDPIDADSAYGYYDSTGTGRGEWTKKPSGGGLLGDIGRGIAKIPFGAELLGAASLLNPLTAPYAPYIYAGASGLRGGATGQDPLKVGLQTGLTVGIATSLGGAGDAGAQPTSVGGTPGVSEVYQVAPPGGTSAPLPPQAAGASLAAGAPIVNATPVPAGELAFPAREVAVTPNATPVPGSFQSALPGLGVETAASAAPFTAAAGSFQAAVPSLLAPAAGGGLLSGMLSGGVSDALLGASLLAGGGQQQPTGMPGQQAPFQPTGVDYSGILGLLGQRASVPGIQSLLGPAQIRYPNSLLG